MPSDDRYDRQARLPGFGLAGQQRLRGARVLVAGCGALGTVVAEQLVRAGVGTVELVDRDVVERSNLQRQTLFTETDAHRGVPKAEAAKSRLAQVNSEPVVRAIVADLAPDNALSLCSRADVVVDCLDNFETRYLLNDCAVALGIPLVYGGAVGFRGMAAAILPATGPSAKGLVRWGPERTTPCLACLAPEPPTPGEIETCDVAGVLAAAAGIVGSLEAALALRLLAEREAAVPPVLVRFDLASMSCSSASIVGARDPACPCCAGRRFRHLAPPHGLADAAPRWRVLCGRRAVELALGGVLDDAAFERLRARLGALAPVVEERFGATRSLRAQLPATAGADVARDATSDDGAVSISVLASGDSTLAIVVGTSDPERARALVSRFVGC